MLTGEGSLGSVGGLEHTCVLDRRSPFGIIRPKYTLSILETYKEEMEDKREVGDVNNINV